MRWSVPPLTVPDREPIVLHAIEGEHFGDFDADDAARLLRHRLARRRRIPTAWAFASPGRRSARRKTDEILSGPTALGSVQVPANGVPIALMADHQTTGGYPRIAEIASADVPRLAQLAPGGTRALRALQPRHGGRAAQATRASRLEPALRGIAWEYGK